MTRSVSFAALGQAALAALVLTIGGTVPANAGPEISSKDVCPKNAYGMRDGVGTVVGCWCPASGPAGSVWGSGPYTADSDICTAARHAGLVSKDGDAVWLRVTKGLESYQGTAANGVTSSDYGAYDGSISFITADASRTLAVCPANGQGKTGSFKCQCSAEQAAAIGQVWGTDIYTVDSKLCRSAVHAGVIGASGGRVSVEMLPGQDKYSGSTRNGITSADYGRWGGSFRFVE